MGSSVIKMVSRFGVWTFPIQDDSRRHPLAALLELVKKNDEKNFLSLQRLCEGAYFLKDLIHFLG